jgi:uncharacterized protein YxjI
MAARIFYTKYIRSHDKTGLWPASNATGTPPPDYEKAITVSETSPDLEKALKAKDETYIEEVSSNSSFVSLTPKHTPTLSQTTSIFPQYIAGTTSELTIKEDGLPNLSESFTIFNGGSPLFKIDRQRPSRRHRQQMIDLQTGELIMSLRKNFGTLPRSFEFFDPSNNRVLDLQGNFFVPATGAKSRAFMMNAETGQKTELVMKSSYKNRHATIRDANDEVLVDMESDFFGVRNLVGGRRTYKIAVRAGVDMALAVALIVALDARAQ